MKVVTAKQMREFEAATDRSGLSYAQMMENAGRLAAQAIRERRRPEQGPVLVLVGPGNNGGDGLVCAHYLHESGYNVMVYVSVRKVRDDDDLSRVQADGIPLVWASDDPGMGTLCCLLDKADTIVDALLGTGLTRPVEGILKEILRLVCEYTSQARIKDGPLSRLVNPVIRAKKPYVVAIDLPSGLNSDTGAVDPVTPPADLTVTFAFPKVGLFLPPGVAYVGELVVADIGIPVDLAADVDLEVATAEEARTLLPARPRNANKGTFGKALIVAGSANYTGAPYLAAAAATRVGAGLVTLAVPGAIYPVLAASIHEATFLVLPDDVGALAPDAVKVLIEPMSRYQALLLGPGIGQEIGTAELVWRLLGSERPDRKTRIGFLESKMAIEIPASLPMVIDADALNILAQKKNWWKELRGSCLLTPHPGEMARLLRVETADVQADRIGIARHAAAEWGQVVLLKGACSVLASPEGHITILPFANPALATAGTGDILAGAIVGLLAQGLGLYEAALLGAYLHGLAGEMARQDLGDAGVVAGDLLPRLPLAIKRLRGDAE
ncbi:MAG: NAD(P)H-hydrate dehydratase [Chloroflexi bacterium]|nr:NAD(P)H-hydrate dehydratase [Chloroflexota bacterium]